MFFRKSEFSEETAKKCSAGSPSELTFDPPIFFGFKL